jgi:hypothetical protein
LVVGLGERYKGTVWEIKLQTIYDLLVKNSFYNDLYEDPDWSEKFWIKQTS